MTFPEPPACGGYAVIVADPPWPYANIGWHSDRKGVRALTDHYRLMPLEEIQALPVGGLAAGDCHLFLWTTQGFLPESLAVLTAWGFEYKRMLVWHKQQQGFQLPGKPDSNCEFAIHGVKGKPKFLETQGFKCCWTAKRGRHSEKPSYFYQLLARVTGGPRIDLFARKRHPGFDAWGDEVQDFTQGNLALPETTRKGRPPIKGIAELLRQGLSVPEVAAQVGCHPATVYRVRNSQM